MQCKYYSSMMPTQADWTARFGSSKQPVPTSTAHSVLCAAIPVDAHARKMGDLSLPEGVENDRSQDDEDRFHRVKRSHGWRSERPAGRDRSPILHPRVCSTLPHPLPPKPCRKSKKALAIANTFLCAFVIPATP